MTEDGLLLPAELLGQMERYAVYRCYSDQGELLYVGQSGNLGRRLARHAQKIWFLHVRGITLEWYADELDALKAERRAIHVEHPKYNIQHRDARTLTAPSPRQRGPQPDKVADTIRSHPDWDNPKIATRCGVSVRTVQRWRKREMNGAAN